MNYNNQNNKLNNKIYKNKSLQKINTKKYKEYKISQFNQDNNHFQIKNMKICTEYIFL